MKHTLYTVVWDTPETTRVKSFVSRWEAYYLFAALKADQTTSRAEVQKEGGLRAA